MLAEHPDLRLWSARAPLAPGPSDAGVRRRLDRLADRIDGRVALALPAKAVPQAHRVFFRHVGLDPDVTRTPVEAAALERLTRGGLESRGRLGDALALAVLETGVGVWALDAALLAGPLELRPARAEEPLGPTPLPAGRLVVADARGALAVLFAAPARAVPSRRTREVVLFAVQVPGVSALEAGEALWLAAEALEI